MKKISTTVYLFSISVLLLLNFKNSTAQIINSESFDGVTFPPTGWTLNTAVTTGGQGGPPTPPWVRSTTGTFPPNTFPHSGAAMARFRSHSYTTCTQALFTPVIDYSGLGANDTAKLSFWMLRDTGLTNSFDSLSILVNTNASLTGASRIGAVARLTNISLPDTALQINGWYYFSFNVPQSFNTNSNYLIFSGYGYAGNNIHLDDVQWTSYPPQCSGIPTIGTLNANPTLICGGSGTTILSLTGQSAGESGLSTVWQSSSSATGPWTDVANDISTYTSSTLSVTTYFRCYISCSNSGSADTSLVTQINVSISPLPVLTVAPNGGAAFCNGGDPVILSVTGATTYTWSPSTGLDISTGDLVFASPTINTIYTVIGSDSSGCAASATLNITVANGPTINPSSPNDTVCTGSIVNLNSGAGGGGGGGNTYQWNPGGINTGNAQVNPTSTTTYTLTATSNFSGCSSVDSVIIVVTQDVAANFGYTMNGNTVLFHDSSFNASSWSWNFGDGNGSSNQNPIYTFSGTGSYTVTLIVTSAGCPGGDTIQIQLSVFQNSINDIINANQLLIYPNPVTDNLLHLNFVMKYEKAELTIVNSLGQVVINKNFSSGINKQMNETINLNDFVSGLYEISLKSGEKNSSVRFVKY